MKNGISRSKIIGNGSSLLAELMTKTDLEPLPDASDECILAQEPDRIILDTVIPDFPFPATSRIVQHELKATGAGCGYIRLMTDIEATAGQLGLLKKTYLLI